MKWDDGLVIDNVTVEDISDHDMIAFQHNIEALYELSYKYDMIDTHKHSDPDQKAKWLAIADAGVRDAARNVARILSVVFSDWLDAHALTDPKEWALQRMGDPEEYWARGLRQPRTSYENALNDYSIHKYFNDHPDELRMPLNVAKAYTRQFEQEIVKNAAKFKTLKKMAREFADSVYEADMEDYKAGYLDEKPQKRTLEDLFDVYDISEMVEQMTPEDGYDFVKDIYQYVVFPEWFKRWKRQGIVSTRKRVEKAYAKAEDIADHTANYDIRDLITQINLIINTAHQTGSMIEYIEEGGNEIVGYEDIGDLLNQMSDPPDEILDAWNTELARMGVLPEIDHSAYERRRARAVAKQIVRDAWKDLAKRARNPKKAMPLQRLVRRMVA